MESGHASSYIPWFTDTVPRYFFLSRAREPSTAASRLLAAKNGRQARRSRGRRRRLNNGPSKKDYCPNMNIRPSPLYSSPSSLNLSHLILCEEPTTTIICCKKNDRMRSRLLSAPHRRSGSDVKGDGRRKRGSERGFKVNNRHWQNI